MIRESGIPYAVFACSFFMENAHHLEKGDVIRVPVIKRPYHYVAQRNKPLVTPVSASAG